MKASFYVPNTLPMRRAIALPSIMHPGRVLVGRNSEIPSLNCAQKKKKRAMKKCKKLAKLEKKLMKLEGSEGNDGFVELVNEVADLKEGRAEPHGQMLRPNVFKAKRCLTNAAM